MVTITDRDRRALLVLVAGVAVSLTVYFWPASSDGVVGGEMNSFQAERRLTKLRQRAAEAPGREMAVDAIAKELAQREKGLISAQTLPQAQAQLLQIVRRIASAQQPPLVFRSSDFAPARDLGGVYGVVAINLTFDGGIEQVINFVADVGNQPEALATSEITMGTAHQKTKNIPARLAVSALVDKKLIPVKKENLF